MPSWQGGGGLEIFFATAVSLVRCHIFNNSVASGYGGGIFNWASMLEMTDCVVSANRVYGHSGINGLGGGIFNLGGTLRAWACTLVGNFAGQAGGRSTTESEWEQTVTSPGYTRPMRS